ncbi:FadR/GntR family transcriptional regulator [Nakamurella lactea]|uniref:FadR/GntR family transcriptional regulator n=1 Tax=Nakamurella lactea TaxID=459515 RepID=UPI000401309E|nr:FCD domain-containing protein [Nakamurella lactea]
MDDESAGASTLTPAPKRAAVLCAQIEDEIISANLGSGHLLGSESELSQRYDVSKAVVREAVRLLEHRRAAVAKRGRNGGIFVLASARDMAISLVCNYIDFAGVSTRELNELRGPLEVLAVERAAEHIDDDDITKLRALLRTSRGGGRPWLNMHRALVAASKNPALDVLLGAILDSIWKRVPVGIIAPKGTDDDHTAIVEAIIAGRAADAAVLMREHLNTLARQTTRGTVTTPRPMAKLPARLAEAIAREIHSGGHVPGDVLGSEADLLEQHGVSRGVLREAVRILEHHGVAAMHRGPGGGLVVGRMSSARAAQAVRRYLDMMDIPSGSLSEVRNAIELATVEYATMRLSDQDRKTLLQHLEFEDAERSDQLEIGYQFHRVLSRMTDNRAIELLADVLSSVQGARVSEKGDPGALLDAMHRAHGRIAQAMLDGDVAVARRRMTRHLQDGVDPLVGPSRSTGGSAA